MRTVTLTQNQTFPHQDWLITALSLSYAMVKPLVPDNHGN